MRVWAVIGLVLLAGSAWAFAAEPSVVASRGSATRAVLSADVVADALRAAGMAMNGAQVKLPGALTATTARPELRVSGAERRGTAVVVRLRCAEAAECLPFFAEVQTESTEAATEMEQALQGAGREARGNAETRGSVEARSKEDRMAAMDAEMEHGVVVGARIRLELRDRQMRIVLPAVAVDAGAPGTEVRVASVDRKHLYRGVVVDAGTVRGGVE